MGLRVFAWTFALISGIVVLPLWLIVSAAFIPPLPVQLTIAAGASMYALAYLFGVSRTGRMWPLHLLLIPVYSTLEASTALYAVLRYSSEFIVIEK